MERRKSNLVLIGMPGVGKSTVGVLLAKFTSRCFIDTDLLIQAGQEKRLQEIINSQGLQQFCELEERCVLGLETTHAVIATGGSVVYSRAGMAHLKRDGVIIHLYLPLPFLMQRLTDLDSRGVVMPPGVSLEQLECERQPLYEQWRDLAIDCTGRNHQEVVNEIIRRLTLPPGDRC
jgi:shikimate kinase